MEYEHREEHNEVDEETFENTDKRPQPKSVIKELQIGIARLAEKNVEVTGIVLGFDQYQELINDLVNSSVVYSPSDTPKFMGRDVLLRMNWSGICLSIDLNFNESHTNPALKGKARGITTTTERVGYEGHKGL